MKVDPSGHRESPSAKNQDDSERPGTIYRGFSGPHFGTNHPFSNPYLDKPREPRSLPADRQGGIGAWFAAKHGVDYWDVSLFATGSIPVARAYAGEYGSVGILEPEDKSSCKICWSPVYADLFGEVESRPSVPVSDILEEGKYEVFGWQDEEKRREAASSGHELMVIAPRFVVVKWI